MKSWMSDVIVTVSALAVAVGFGYLYYLDLNAEISGGNRQQVGTITFERNLTQRRFANRVVWQQVGSSAALYNHDSIRTAAGSYAVIRLEDGTQISLSPESLITLDWGTKSKGIDFLSGSISAIRSGRGAATSSPPGGTARSGPPSGLVIRNGHSRVVLTTASVNLATTAGGTLSMSVASGQAMLAVGTSVQTVAAAHTARIAASGGSATIKRLSIEPRTPDNNAIVVTLGRRAPVDFAWKAPKSTGGFRFAVSPSTSFAAGTRSLATAQDRLKMNLAPGDYYWRVSGDGGTSPIEQLSVFHDVPSTPQTPYAGELFHYTSRPPLVGFSWTPSKVAGRYEVLVSTDRNFSSVVRRVAVSGNSVTLDTLTAGNYYWRVVPIYGNGPPSAGAASKVASFRVDRLKALHPAALITPLDHASVNLVTLRNSGLLFNWSAENSIGRWTITVARDRSMSRIVTTKVTKNNYYVLQSGIGTGTYYWRVQGVSVNGEAGPPSSVRTFTLHRFRARIDLLSPRSNWAYDGATFGNVPVIWRSDLHGRFKVELSTKSDFSTLYRQISTTFNNSSFGPLPPGTYFWRVFLLLVHGSIELTSGIHTFTILPPLAAPIAVTPSPSKQLKLINPKKLTFRWDGDPRSQFYDFRLYAPSGRARERLVARSDNLKVNEYVLKDLSVLGKGTFTWEVSAHNPAGPDLSPQESPLTRATFKIGTLRFIPAPKLLSPSENDVINGVSALLHGVSFHWVPPDPYGSSILQIASDPEFVTGLHQFSTTSGDGSLPELLPGIYYWRVQSKTHDGIAAPASAINEFTVANLPPLPQPTQVSPTADTTVSMGGKKGLDFSWSRVPDASGYTITLTNVQTGAVVFHHTGLTVTFYRYTDLHNLNVGEFAWTIRATETDRLGKVVRTSDPLTSKFLISLGKIAPATINTPKQLFVH